MSFADEIPGINAILYLCQLGTEGGHAFADIIRGKVTPSGKLSDTWAKKYEDIPFANEYSYLNGDLENEYYKEGIYDGYRYFDSFGVKPAFPFGYGLSYAEFSIHSAGVSVKGTEVEAKALVSNISTMYSGKEVTQLYLSAPNGKIHKEYQSLVAFAKTKVLQPGEKTHIRLSFDLRDAAYYREEDGCYVLEAGSYILRLGNSSRNTIPIAVLNLEKECIVSQHDHICVSENKVEELTTCGYSSEDIHAAVPRLEVSADAFETVCYRYHTPEICTDAKVRQFLDQLTLKDMVDIVVGIGMFGGETRFTLPGSVGNTTQGSGIRGLSM